MEQPFVKDPDHTIQELLTSKISTIGENLILKRFARFQIGDISKTYLLYKTHSFEWVFCSLAS